jgi:hypothetical protein
MATRSLIAVQNADGTFLSIYCHWDGYPSGVGKDLLNEHNGAQAARALMKHGDLSTLSPLASYRSRSGKNVDAQVHNSMEDLHSFALDCGVDWIYLWTTEWMCQPYGGFAGKTSGFSKKWKTIKDAIKAESE